VLKEKEEEDFAHIKE